MGEQIMTVVVAMNGVTCLILLSSSPLAPALNIMLDTLF